MDLQVLRHDELSAKAEQNTQHEYWQAPRRGDILDVNGNILATSMPVKTICADPSLIGNFQPLVAHAIAPLLQLNETDLAQKLTPRLARNAKGEIVTNNLHYVRLAKNISDDTWRQIHGGDDESDVRRGREKFAAQAKGIFPQSPPARDFFRTGPDAGLSERLAGGAGHRFSGGRRKPKSAGGWCRKSSGATAWNLAMQKQLSGVAGWKVTETDRAQHELVALRDEDVHPRDGLNVVLTIDSVVQHIVETALADALQKHTPRSITGIVMRPKTGEILAMVSLPNYDPNQPNTITPETRNRVLPMSSSPVRHLNCRGVRRVEQRHCQFEHAVLLRARRVLRSLAACCTTTSGFGNDTESIITKSSNIGAAKIGIRLGADNLYSYAWNYGFGQRTGIPLPGEARGFLYPVKNWSKVSIAQIPMGHGVAVTRLQMLYAMAAIANHGG